MIADPAIHRDVGVISTNKLYLLQFFTVDMTLTPRQVVINTQSFLGVSQGKVPHVEHPNFNATTNQGMTPSEVLTNGCGARPTPSLCDLDPHD